MGDMSDLEVQKRLWGRDGHGIPGANPNYAGRVGILAVVVVVILSVTFVILSDHSPEMPNMRYFNQYVSDVAPGDVQQTQFPQALVNSPAAASTIVHDLVRTLRSEDRSLVAGQWPVGVRRDIKRFVAINQQQISVLNMYPSASKSERSSLITKQVDDAIHALKYDVAIHESLNTAEW
jgi:hypothetical protein